MPLKPNAAHARTYQKPLRLGNEEISWKILFVYWEQGFGDTFLLFSYIKLLKKYHINVIFQVVKSVLTLLKHMSNDAELIGLNDQIPEFDFIGMILISPNQDQNFLISDDIGLNSNLYELYSVAC